METINNIMHFEPQTSSIQNLGRWVMGGILVYIGLAHLSFSREDFQAQVPPYLPFNADLIVVLSGIVEITLGGLLIFLPKYRAIIGWTVAIFLVLIFPGNISQYTEQIDAFGLDTDRDRFIRLLFQPVFVVGAVWSTGAWKAWCNRETLLIH